MKKSIWIQFIIIISDYDEWIEKKKISGWTGIELLMISTATWLSIENNNKNNKNKKKNERQFQSLSCDQQLIATWVWKR